MSTYKYEYCPYCKKRLTNWNGERSEAFFYSRYIGLKYERCPNCKKIYSTNKKLYNQMNDSEKKRILLIYPINILSCIISLFVFTSLPIFLIGGLFIELFKINIDSIILNNIIYGLLFVLGLLSIILGFLASKKDYKRIKELTIDSFDIDDELKQLNK